MNLKVSCNCGYEARVPHELLVISNGGPPLCPRCKKTMRRDEFTATEERRHKHNLFCAWIFIHAAEYNDWLKQHPEIEDSPAAWICFAEEYGQ